MDSDQKITFIAGIVKFLIAVISYGAIVAFIDMQLYVRILLVILVPIFMIIGIVIGLNKSIKEG